MTSSSLHDNADVTPDTQADTARGIHYAATMDRGDVHYPDPERIKRFHQEWEGITGYWKDEEMSEGTK